MEIERKWLFDMNKVPTDKATAVVDYTQAYLSVEPEVRVRTKSVNGGQTTYMLCIKGEGTISRIEVQKSLTKKEYFDLLEVGKINITDVIHKRYYMIPIDKYKLTVGIVDPKKDTSFSYGEIEFESEEEAEKFISPKWFGKDVTDDLSYKMKNYWKRTRLK